MTETEAILTANELEPLNKLRYYMDYFIRCLPNKPSVSFELFCNNKNIAWHDVGDIWKERGFASKEWVNLTAPSIFHSVYHNLSL